MQTHEAAGFEAIKPPCFIQETTLAKTLEKIAEVPREKRKIIVYAGVHPNEGTAELAQKYAQKWADKYGALVVCQPTEETPHGMWKKREPLMHEDGTTPRLPEDLELDEDYYKKEFSLGKKTIFIEFHGTPIQQFEDIREEKIGPKLEVILPIIQDPALEGLATKLPDTRIEKRQDNYAKWRPQTSDTILIEHYYDGQPVEVEDPYFQKILRQEKLGEEPIFSEGNWDRQMNFGPEYLEQHAPTEEDRRRFDEKFAAQFELLLEHIAERLPKD